MRNDRDHDNSSWYNAYKSFSEEFCHEIQSTKTISNNLLSKIWCEQNNGIAKLTLAVIPRKSYELIKDELLEITLQIMRSSDEATFVEVSKKMKLLKDEKKLDKNYQAVKNRLYALIYPDKFTTIIGSEMLFQVYSYLNSKFSLNLPERMNWFNNSISLKFIINKALGVSFDHFLTNILLWEIYLISSYDTNDEHIVEKKNSSQSSYPLNQILYGPPGTGKTYNTIIKALEIIGDEIFDKDRNQLKALFDAYVEKGQIVFTTFHQSMCYEDFIEGIKPIANDNTNSVGYQIEDGILKTIADRANFGNLDKLSSIDEAIEKFKQLCIEQTVNLKTINGSLFNVKCHEHKTFRIYPHNSAVKNLNNGYPASIAAVIEYIETGDLSNGYNTSYVKAIGEYLISEYGLDQSKKSDTIKQNFVLIIDEINRGNVSQILGELITLIEQSKRLGNPEALTVTLPYSKKLFGVPNNLYIIGTMNTADRSVESLDSALRRRFSFTEMLPDYTCIVDKKGCPVIIEGINLSELLLTLNQRIERLLDREHQIGHSYLLNVETTQDLCETFNNKIIPLLQEYFFNDYAKIGLILGNGFITEEQNNVSFANFTTNEDFENNEPIYRLKIVTSDNIIDALKETIPTSIL